MCLQALLPFREGLTIQCHVNSVAMNDDLWLLTNNLAESPYYLLLLCTINLVQTYNMQGFYVSLNNNGLRLSWMLEMHIVKRFSA